MKLVLLIVSHTFCVVDSQVNFLRVISKYICKASFQNWNLPLCCLFSLLNLYHLPLVHGSKCGCCRLQLTKNLRMIIFETALKDSETDSCLKLGQSYGHVPSYRGLLETWWASDRGYPFPCLFFSPEMETNPHSKTLVFLIGLDNQQCPEYWSCLWLFWLCKCKLPCLVRCGFV